MKALVSRHNLAREAASAIGRRADRRAFVFRMAPARLEDVDDQPLPGSRDNPLTALVSFPHVLGHEVAGRKTDTNERGVLNPWLSCVPRGVKPPCDACLARHAMLRYFDFVAAGSP